MAGDAPVLGASGMTRRSSAGASASLMNKLSYCACGGAATSALG